jgi:hypothetical protein
MPTSLQDQLISLSNVLRYLGINAASDLINTISIYFSVHNINTMDELQEIINRKRGGL